ncbi:MAG: M1 family metallopeptidase [Ferruginibacter sp.]
MKSYFLFLNIIFIFLNSLYAQAQVSGNDGNHYNDFVGVYQTPLDSSVNFTILQQDNHLMMDISGQGKIELSPVSKNTFRAKGIKNKTLIKFIKNPLGNIYKLTWNQNAKLEWNKIDASGGDSVVFQNEGPLSEYTGAYQQDGNPSPYWKCRISLKNNQLTGQTVEGAIQPLMELSKNKFIFKQGDLSFVYEFFRSENGGIQKLVTNRTGPIDIIKIPADTSERAILNHVSNRQNGFTRADSLRGMLTTLRTCYDVLFYDLNVSVDPASKSIQGNTIIRFKAIQPFDKIQVDLFANMKIEKILFHNQQLSYTREFNAVFIQFPTTINKESEGEISIFYAGKPQVPDPSALRGGFFWLWDRNGKFWIESVCQGAGASLWWPCKDHLSDEPDSMKISVTVPNGLMDISNGRLQNKTDLPDNRTRFDWYVSYPINNYNVVLNIGDYAHFTDLYIRHQDTLTLNYYCMRYNTDIAKQIFAHAKPMLANYEKDFGDYPFLRDGFTLMESIYPMEHQGAVSIGAFNSPFNSDQYDTTELVRLMWHESAHEWWGNSVTCKDMADLWIHEAFATYAEVLNYEAFYGKTAGLKYLKSQVPGNKESIIGVYDVNDFELGDVYSKGVWMLHTLRNIIDNDTAWFGMLRGIQEHFKYQTVTTYDIVKFINSSTQKDYTYFFDQYLKHTAIPELQLIFKKEGALLNVQYRWKTDTENFNMPVKATTSKNNFEFIYPTNDWKNIQLQNMDSKDFKIDRDGFYIGIKTE